MLPISRVSTGLLKNITSRNGNTMVKRNFLIATPPQRQWSFANKMMCGALMSLCSIAFPVWVICHVPEYQGETAKKD